MLLSNSRIEKTNKIKFYEQDILLDDNVYTGNIDITLDVEYVCPGIGITLIADEGLSLNERSESYLFRVGHSEYSIVARIGERITVLENGPAVNVKPYKEHFYFRIRKIGGRVSLFINGKEITRRYLPTDLNSFTIGYYSNAGNTINSVSIASDIPEGWVVNMNNTEGGYIKFSPNKFAITNCSDLAEVEQINIELKENEIGKKYYLKYEQELIDGQNDIVPYVFKSDDNRYNDKEKNLLNSDNTFLLKSDDNVNLKFKGTIGAIKNIYLTSTEDDFYAETTYDKTTIEESYIKIKTSELSKIEWTGTVYNVPMENKYAIVQDMRRMYTESDLNIRTGKGNSYEYTVDIKSIGSSLTIKSKDESRVFNLNISDYFYIFRNIDAIMTKLLLYKKDGTIINIIVQDTKKQYVPANITSPIIVTTENNVPLDLSSSYRVIEDDDKLYYFTNIEREKFTASNRIRLTNKPLDKIDTVTVYGVKKNSTTYPDKIMHSENKELSTLSSYCTSYDIIHESELFNIDKTNGIITISDTPDDITKNYKEIVVDYLKKNSYSINYNHELLSYEIDISCDEKTQMYYDGIMTDSGDNFSNTGNYKIFNSEIKNNSYIVLKGR